MNHFQPIKQVKASEEVSNQLHQAIFQGRYGVGDKLPSERELIETFQVSRTVIREAIKRLEAKGLIEIKQGATGGAFVKEFTFERLSRECHDLFFLGKMSFSEICQARLAIEPMVAGLAAINGTDEQIQALIEADNNENQTIEYPETVQLRQKVHYLLADMCQNRFLTAIDKSLIQIVANITQKFQPDTNLIHPLGMHKSIIDAVVARDQVQAEIAMREHLTEFISRLKFIEDEYRHQHEA
ncbi:FadR/GntR family transcriptional regulator [Shewanella sp. Isolate11]|uniref:FadR/GntR family transcriptional regulator n=1 Tax=Shewanella sp. Isolate11 TaxID=2908530 RepID=UPI001EFD93C3|nr:FadR/GntR family transcriptional regulator [Shewanella sp. Isolate11]MCG9695654.1 FadR family transcriptional regulator [Shewanella sp. Isolate11]